MYILYEFIKYEVALAKYYETFYVQKLTLTQNTVHKPRMYCKSE